MARDEEDAREVPPLEDTAHLAIDTEEGYVRIEQDIGNQPLYTPEEAREIAADIEAAAERAREEYERERD